MRRDMVFGMILFPMTVASMCFQNTVSFHSARVGRPAGKAIKAKTAPRPETLLFRDRPFAARKHVTYSLLVPCLRLVNASFTSAKCVIYDSQTASFRNSDKQNENRNFFGAKNSFLQLSRLCFNPKMSSDLEAAVKGRGRPRSKEKGSVTFCVWVTVRH